MDFFKKKNNIPPTTYTLIYIGLLLMLLAVLLTLFPTRLTHAKTDKNSKDKKERVEKTEIVAQEREDDRPEQTEDVTKGDADENAEAETPVDTVPASTPAPINNEAEDILNEIIPAPEPATTTPSLPTSLLAPATTSPTIPADATTEPAQPAPTITPITPIAPKPTQSTSTTRRNRPIRTESAATTTPAQGSTGKTDESTVTLLPPTGGQSTVAATNYYTPLDTLSPTATYSLSALALALGISGILLFMNSPRIREEETWIPHLQPGETLLET